MDTTVLDYILDRALYLSDMGAQDPEVRYSGGLWYVTFERRERIMQYSAVNVLDLIQALSN